MSTPNKQYITQSLNCFNLIGMNTPSDKKIKKSVAKDQEKTIEKMENLKNKDLVEDNISVVEEEDTHKLNQLSQDESRKSFDATSNQKRHRIIKKLSFTCQEEDDDDYDDEETCLKDKKIKTNDEEKSNNDDNDDENEEYVYRFFSKNNKNQQVIKASKEKTKHNVKFMYGGQQFESLTTKENQNGEQEAQNIPRKSIQIDSLNSFAIGNDNQIYNLLDSKTLIQQNGDNLYAVNEQSILSSFKTDEQQNKNKLNSITKKKIICNCKNSKCLKKYCECFAAGELCSDECKCIDCKNNTKCQDERNDAIQKAIDKDKTSFNPKLKVDQDTKEVTHTKGCNCKKSGCNKKYCECFKEGVKCNSQCKCEGCENQEGSCKDNASQVSDYTQTRSQIKSEANMEEQQQQQQMQYQQINPMEQQKMQQYFMNQMYNRQLFMNNHVMSTLQLQQNLNSNNNNKMINEYQVKDEGCDLENENKENTSSSCSLSSQKKKQQSQRINNYKINSEKSSTSNSINNFNNQNLICSN